MADFEIIGTVVERSTRRGVRGVRVEAWDRDTRYHDMLGSAVTDAAGRFRMTFTDEYYGDYAGDRLPDIFYRVYRGDSLVLSTQDEPSENVEPGRILVTLEIDPVTEPKAAEDRVSVDTAIKALTFLQQSDFRGVRNEAGGQLRMSGGLLGTMLANGFREWDWKPVGPSKVRQSDVLNEETATAQARLAERNVEVQRVEKYDPKLDRGSARLLTAPPARLKAGERVVLYEQDGKVKYYARVRDEPAATIDQAEVQRLGGEVEAVKMEVADVSALRDEVDALKATSEQERGETRADIDSVREQLSEVEKLRQTLAEMRAELDQRNRTIAGLQAELTTVKESQEQIEGTDLLQRVNKLEVDIRRLGPR